MRDSAGSAQPGVSVRVRYIDAPKRLRLDDGLAATTDASGAFTLASGRALANVLVRAVVRVQTPRVNEEGGGPGTVVTPGGEERPFGNELRKHVKTGRDGHYEMAGLPAQRFTSVEGGTVTADFVLPD